MGLTCRGSHLFALGFRVPRLGPFEMDQVEPVGGRKDTNSFRGGRDLGRGGGHVDGGGQRGVFLLCLCVAMGDDGLAGSLDDGLAALLLNDWRRRLSG